MIEDVLRSQASAQQAPQSTKNSAPKEDFKKFLKQAQDEAQAQKSKTASNAQGATQGAQEVGVQEVSESQKPNLSNTLDSKAKPTTALTKTQNTTKNTKTLNPLAQALSTTPESKAQIETSNQNATQNARIKLAKLPEPQNKLEQKELDSKNPKTLEDVLNLAKEQNLNPTKISAEAESEQPQIASKPKPKPLSATQKIEYEFESKEERVAVINRGVRKPKNITSKISNIYEEAKKDEGTPSLSALLGQKDLPRQS